MLVVDVLDKTIVKSIKVILENENNSLIKPITTRKEVIQDEGESGKGQIIFELKTNFKDESVLLDLLKDFTTSVVIRHTDSAEDDANSNHSSLDHKFKKYGPILEFIGKFLIREHIIADDLVEDFLTTHCSSKYSLYPPLILFNYSPIKQMFYSDTWREKVFINEEIQKKFFKELMSQVFNGSNVEYTHVAINNPITETDNILRKPLNIIPMFGDFKIPENNEMNFENPSEEILKNGFWCTTVQNGIFQQWAPIYTMFSRGNIKEKARILIQPQPQTQLQETVGGVYYDISGNDVLDMYSGIGYFTLSYMKRGARNVFGFDLNPWSCEGLKSGLENKKNKKHFPGKCHIYNESNEYSMERLSKYEAIENLKLKVRHINMGLLPTSEPGWNIAVDVANKFHGECNVTTLHIHENIHIDHINDNSFVNGKLLPALNKHISEKSYSTIKKLDVTHIEKIKTFAPDVWHVCIDLDIYFL